MVREIPKAKIVERRQLTGDLMVLRLDPGFDFLFEPGQYATIGRNGVERPYSIVSAPHEPQLELLIELVPWGSLTPRLWALAPGDQVTLRPRAKGRFTLDRSAPDHLMIATVTGIAPFVSMLRSKLPRTAKTGSSEERSAAAGQRFFVLHGASHRDEIAYSDEIAAASAQYPGKLTYVATLSRPAEARNAGWTGETGRVNEIAERYVARFHLEPASAIAYACGHPGMIDDVRTRLARRGFAVREERFWSE